MKRGGAHGLCLAASQTIGDRIIDRHSALALAARARRLNTQLRSIGKGRGATALASEQK